jgi:protein YIPF1/2
MREDDSNDRDDLLGGGQNIASRNEKEKDEIAFCGCMSMRYYQPLFDVDTKDISSRISQSLFYCQRAENFMSVVSAKPDLYGPFWITTTLVFTIAVCSHMSSWLSSWMYGSNWQYDLQSMVNAATVVYGYAGLVPTVAYLYLRQIDVDVRFTSMLCLYGYSLSVFIIASLLCLIPSNTIIWLSLLTSAGISSVFVMRNIVPQINERAPDSVKTASIAIGVVQLVFIYLLKAAIF